MANRYSTLTAAELAQGIEQESMMGMKAPPAKRNLLASPRAR